ncbi:MAG: hypothetical protein ABIY50_08410 [Ignavibacteria bacterium]
MRASKFFGLFESLSKNASSSSMNKNLFLSDAEKSSIIENLGEENFNIHWNEGKEMKLDEAVSDSFLSYQLII